MDKSRDDVMFGTSKCANDDDKKTDPVQGLQQVQC